MRYQFTMPPQEVASLPSYLARELSAISQSLTAPSDVVGLVPQTQAPKKPRTGYLVCADGVLWNPGAGAGIYWYTGSAWSKL